MTSAEEVPRITCSIGARQAEPPAPKEELVHVFFCFNWPIWQAVFRPPGPPMGSHVEGPLYDER